MLKRCKPHIARKLEKFIPAKLGGDNRKSFVGVNVELGLGMIVVVSEAVNRTLEQR